MISWGRSEARTRRTPVSFVSGFHSRVKELTGESRIEPTRLILIRRMNRFPICFMISLLGSWWDQRSPWRCQLLTPIFPVSDRLFGISFVCSIVLLISSSKSDILTDCESAWDRESFVLDVSWLFTHTPTCRMSLFEGLSRRYISYGYQYTVVFADLPRVIRIVEIQILHLHILRTQSLHLKLLPTPSALPW